jgi:hypothetical protein
MPRFRFWIIPIIAASIFVSCQRVKSQTNADVSALELEVSNLTARLNAMPQPPAVLRSVVFSNDVAVATNDVVPASPAPLQPVLVDGIDVSPLIGLLGGHSGKIAAFLTWLIGVNTVLAPLRSRIKNYFSDKFNGLAANSPDEDAYLRNLFSKPWYQTLAFISCFTPFPLPTIARLKRAVALQAEAVQKAAVNPYN